MKFRVFHKPTDQCKESKMTLATLAQFTALASSINYTDVTAKGADLILLESLRRDKRIGSHLPVIVALSDEGLVMDYVEEPKVAGDVVIFMDQSLALV